jgi:hypothetical protein
MLEDFGSELGQAQTAGRPFEQAGAELILERGDPAADRG